MQKYGVNELRRMFLEFFESKEHLAMKSFSLVPHNDKSLLLINSGMAPLKPYFTGQEIPPRKRVTTCQKCIRTGDIETGCTLRSTWMTTRRLKSGISRSAFRRSGFSGLEKRIISGNMVPALAVPAQKYIMTEANSMAAERKAVR